MQKVLTMGLGRRVALLGALTALAMGLIAGSAFASIEVTPGGPYKNPETVKVRGTAPATATNVAISTCNTTSTILGERCDGAHATELISKAEYESAIPVISLTLARTFKDWTFITGIPAETGTSTTCRNNAGKGDPCAIVASYYKVVGGIPTQLTGTEDIDPIVFK